jgi:Ca2+-binding RTX toxin-like protein
LAFSTVTGSNGVTSLVGTTGVDTTTIVTLGSNTFIAGNTGSDVIDINLATASQIASDYEVRMGGGGDTFELNNTLHSSFIELDGLTADNAGEDTFTGNSELIINCDIRGMGEVDTFTNLALSSSTVNGNAGEDVIGVVASINSFVYGGQGDDSINVTGNGTEMTINGNKGDDAIAIGGLAAITFTGSVYGGNGDDTITQNVTVAATETGVFFSGDLGDDNITATAGIDTINGGDGDDTINGGTGADVIDGGAGADAITGAAGADTMTGGAGNDKFILAAYADSTLTGAGSSTGFDTITDFNPNTEALAADIDGDRIQLVGAAAAALGTATTRAGTTSLADDLLAEVTFAGAAANEIDIVIITDAAWAGNYLVVNAAGAGAGAETFDVTADAVIKVDNIAGITLEAFNLA